MAIFHRDTGGDEGLREQPAASASPRKVGAGSAHCPPLLALAGTRFPASQHIPRHSHLTTPLSTERKRERERLREKEEKEERRSRGTRPLDAHQGVSQCVGLRALVHLRSAYIHPHLNFHHLADHPRSSVSFTIYGVPVLPGSLFPACLKSPGDPGPRPETSCLFYIQPGSGPP